MEYKYLKGPVFSRRLGKSLGINIISDKSCSFDCVYCEVGSTSNITTKRKEYSPTGEIITELNDYLQKKPELDYITFSSTGEPTLDLGIGVIIKFLKDKFPDYKIALLSNSSLFWRTDVRKEVLRADLIVPSLDAVSNTIFQKINRPDSVLEINKIIDGLVNLRREFQGNIWLEIFIIHGLNDTEDELNKFAQAIKGIKPDKVQLNSLDRPAPEEWVKKTPDNIMKEIKDYLVNTGYSIEII